MPRCRRYALVVVLEAESPEQAWEALSDAVDGKSGADAPECVHVGAPWEGVPDEAEDLGAERLELRLCCPAADGTFVPTTVVLRPCE